MELNEDNYIEILNSYDKEYWRPLLDLIPEIESTEKFGEIAGGVKDDKGFIQMPYFKESPVVTKFFKTFHDLGILVSFDWPNWDVGRKILRKNNFNFDTIDIPTKCKLISTIIRNDRFFEGALVSAFESGMILKIMKSIDRQLNVSLKS